VVERLREELQEEGIRVKVDLREGLSPGYKFNDWELRGVPIRLEIGPRDIESGSVMLARRDIPGREGKRAARQAGIADSIKQQLEEMQAGLLRRAIDFREAHTQDVTTYEEFKEAVQTGFARAWWAGTNDDEQRIQQDTQSSLRCIPFDQPEGSGTCFYSGRPATSMAIFGRGY
jgi:prolyl-tRNA synthetase